MRTPISRRALAAASAAAPIVALIGLPMSSALAASQTFTNACRNGAVPTNWDQISVTNTMSSPAGPVAPGDPVSLTGIGLSMSVPAAIFVAGYNLGLLTTGTNVIPADIFEKIAGTNTVEGTQQTNTVSTTLTTTISDPTGGPGTGDETATDASASLTFDDQTWTAGPTAGSIDFAEFNETGTLNGAAGGGIVAVAHLAGGFINVGFHCTSGTVEGSNPGVATLTSAPTITSTAIVAPNTAPTANAGTDQTVNSGASVTLDGTGSSDPDGNALSYAWTQSGGPSVTLASANTAHPTFTAPTGPADLEFSLIVTDDGSPPLSSAADTVAVHVNAPADHTTTSLAVTQTGFVNEPITFDSDVADTTTPASIPVGAVSWYDNGGSSAVATSAVDASGHATATLASGFAVTGSHSIVAKFVPTDPSLFEQSQSAPVAFDLARHANDPCGDPASQCTDEQNFKATVNAGTLVISTPYTSENPFDLGTLALDPTATYLHASAPFGNAGDPTQGVTITDTRAGDLPWTASVLSTDFADGTNVINACNLGFTDVSPAYIAGNALAPGDVSTTSLPNAGAPGLAPGAGCNSGLGGPTTHQFASAANGNGSVYVVGTMDLYAPTSTVAGIYLATVTFTIA
jgi:hypothetical protein